MNYQKMLEKILSRSEYAGIPPELYSDDYTLFSHLTSINIIGQYDWKHLDETSLYCFIDERMCSVELKGLEPIGIMPDSASKYYMELFPSGKANYVRFVLRYYDSMMKKVGLRLIDIDTRDDCYNLIVVKSSVVTKLKRIKSDFWKFREVK